MLPPFVNNLPRSLVAVGCSDKFYKSLTNVKSKFIPKTLHWGRDKNSAAIRFGGLIFKFTVDQKCSHNQFVVDLPSGYDLKRQGTRILNHGPLPTDRGTQIRRFRTHRETKGEPSSRFKELMSNSKNFFQKEDQFDREAQKIQNMMNNRNVTPEEKTQLKIAFANGYLAAHPTGKTPGKFLSVLQQLLTIVIFCCVLFMIGTSSGFHFGTQQAINPETIKVTFNDVKGANGAKQELQEVVQFLRSPEKFIRLGGKLPKGVLLVGPPGTGKTLMARALAGEAGVPFFHACGAEFDEMLVGQGARRVRDLFRTAKEQAPCVIFIDEIDAVGGKRSATLLHPHANQTVNQLLTEMDGFNSNEGVIVLGATNRREDLDGALLRPGRFDLEVTVTNPDYQGRKELLDLYLSKIKTAPDVDVELLARGTVGFTGADIENMVNQAAIRAGIEEAPAVDLAYIEEAKDKAIMGAEIRSRVPDAESNKITAYHEAGHTLVAYYTKDAQPLHKVTIVARGSSLGHTAYIPEKDKFHVTKSELLAQMDTMMGGRAAEEMVFGPEKVTSGAASDLKSATHLATMMVKEWGMSEKVGLRHFQASEEQRTVGDRCKDVADAEINVLLNESYERARKLLTKHSEKHQKLAEALLQFETLDNKQVEAILRN